MVATQNKDNTGGKLRVLVVDDSRFSQVTTKDMLTRHGMAVNTVASGEDALQYIEEMGLVDVILSDLVMPGIDGQELCAKLRKMYPEEPLGLLLITSSSELELKQRAIAAGADDFLAKPFISEELILRTTLIGDLVRSRREMRRLQGAFEEAKTRVDHLEHQIAATQQRLKMATSRDDMTGLLTRHAFFTMAEREFKRARRYKNNLCLLAVEVDHLATISDSYGFKALDVVFGALGKIVQASIRDVDMAGRFGLDSVGVLLPETPLENAQVVAGRMLERTLEQGLKVEEHELSITFCIGLAGAAGLNTHDELLRKSQRALLQAKDMGPGNIVTL